jgi:D-alanyl-D-alanine carboxypeptidase
MPNGEVLEFAAGLSDVEAGFAMLPDDRLAAGSIGKSFVGAYTAALVTEGVLNLDDKISKYLGKEPWFGEVPNGADITLRMLMNHTAGMSEWYENLPKDMTKAQFLDLMDPRRPRIDVLRYSFKRKPDFKPGTRYEYADSNFMLAALVLEAATGRNYNEEIMRRFFYPLRLRHTAPSLSTTEAGYVQGYYEADDNVLLRMFGKPGERNPYMQEPGIQPINPRFEGAGGGFTSTSHDLALWAKTLFENRAFKGDYLKLAMSAFGPYDKEVGPVSMGMFVWDPAQGYKGGTRISGVQYGHLGSFIGQSAAMMYFPESKLAVAMMFNAGTTREARHALPTELADLVVTALRTKEPAADGH